MQHEQSCLRQPSQDRRGEPEKPDAIKKMAPAAHGADSGHGLATRTQKKTAGAKGGGVSTGR